MASTSPRAKDPINSPVEESRSPAAYARAVVRAAKAQAPRDGRGGDTEIDEEEETPPAAAPVQTDVEVKASSPRTQLHTVYVDTIQPKRLVEVSKASEAGERCMVLHNFIIARICDVSGADATQAKDLVVTKCCCCGHVFPMPTSPIRALKRQRKVWPCGHWLFRLEFRFKLLLQEEECLQWVFVADEANGLLGESADEVAENLEARERAQKRLDALREDLGKPREGNSHSLTVYRHDGPDTSVFGAYVVCDTDLQLLPEALS
ncbi:unnamed protein product [Durusdinium trenchii]|uniref:Replication termination factor 2 n=1 Tax=Durusdinium trenchii TaxID=1381693 RepID=A0ABP0JKA0_9DINO